MAADDCQMEVCDSLATSHPPLAGRGVSLLQALSRNTSASKNASVAGPIASSNGTDSAGSNASASPAASSGTSVSSNVSATSNNASGLQDAIQMANAVGSMAEGSDNSSGTGNETGFLLPAQNLSATTAEGVNYSDVDEEILIPEAARPYAAANESEDNSSIVKIHPIAGASPLPEPDAQNLTAAMKDCILGDWGEWSACLTDGANGYASPHQVRERSIVQPYLAGGQPCGLTMESRSCQLVSAANTLVNLGE